MHLLVRIHARQMENPPLSKVPTDIRRTNLEPSQRYEEIARYSLESLIGFLFQRVVVFIHLSFSDRDIREKPYRAKNKKRKVP